MNSADITGNDSRVAQLTADAMTMAGNKRGAAAAVNAGIACIIGAISPLVTSLFRDCSPQDKVLFTLIFAGSCIHVDSEDNDNLRSTITVDENSVSEALSVYNRLTGKDMAPHLPPSMVRFANEANRAPSLTLN